MSLTRIQLDFALRSLSAEMLKSGPMQYTTPELKQALRDAASEEENASVKAGFHNRLTEGRFKSLATDSNKQAVRHLTLTAIRASCINNRHTHMS